MRTVPFFRIVLLPVVLIAALAIGASADEPTAAETVAPGAPPVASPATVALPEVTALRLRTVVLERATIVEHLRALQLETAAYQTEGQRRVETLTGLVTEAARAAGVAPDAYDYDAVSGQLVRKGGAPAATAAAP